MLMLLKMFISMKMWYIDAEFYYAVFSYICTDFQLEVQLEKKLLVSLSPWELKWKRLTLANVLNLADSSFQPVMPVDLVTASAKQTKLLPAVIFDHQYSIKMILLDFTARKEMFQNNRDYISFHCSPKSFPCILLHIY